MYWKGSGPLFFYTGNEGAIEGFYDNTGFLFELAENFSALIVFAEHVSVCCWKLCPTTCVNTFTFCLLCTKQYHCVHFLAMALCIHSSIFHMLLFSQRTVMFLCLTEQRYYGKSLPYGDSTFTPNHMAYLTAEQALADYAVLISRLKDQYSISKVISFGGR